MSLKNRLGVLALAVLLALFWAFPQYQARWGLRPPLPPAPTVAPPPPAVSIVKAKKKAHRKTAVKITDAKLEQTVSRGKIRGERLREKGEALGGGTAER